MLGTLMNSFGERVTYMPLAGDSKVIQAIFDNEYWAADPETGLVVSSTQPHIGLRLSDLDAEPQKGDRVQIGSTVYRVRDFQPDGLGGAELMLGED